MKLESLYPGADLHRVEKMIYLRFSKPHRILSSARVGGGFRAGGEVEYLGICQGCEPHGGHYGFYTSRSTGMSGEDLPDSERMLTRLAEGAGIPPDRFVGLETAADVQNAGIEVIEGKSITVTAVCTAGVETNALRAGDPASYDEDDFRGHPKGTINILLAVGRRLTPGAMITAVITATEAKSAVLAKLNVGSTGSVDLATGTGTDQIAVACPAAPAAGGGFPGPGDPSGTGSSAYSDTAAAPVSPLADAGKHSLLGELIGRAVTAAVERGLELQNGYHPSVQGRLTAQVRRFGYSPEAFRDLLLGSTDSGSTEGREAGSSGSAGGICGAEESSRGTKGNPADMGETDLEKDKSPAEVLGANFDELDRKPGVTAASAALIHLADLVRGGVLPTETVLEETALFGAQIAAAAADRPSAVPRFLEILAPYIGEFSLTDPVVFIARCITLGFADKWR
jgi:adenosylcobinamide amidohydrolase